MAKGYPEMTLRAVLIGYALGCVICMSVMTMGLRAGTTIVGSIPAAIIGMAIYMAIFKRSRILEVDIIQTACSSVDGVAAGVAFTVPALYVLGMEDFSLWPLVIASLLGGVGGVALIILLRRQLIEVDYLPFPSGIACATILKTPGTAIKKSYVMLGTAIVGVAITLMALPSINLIPQELDFANWLGLPEYFLFSLAVDTMLVGCGLIIGPYYGTFQFVFAMLGYWLIIPYAAGQGIIPGELGIGRTYITTPLGVGTMLGATIMSMALMAPGLSQGMKEIMHTRIRGGDEDVSGVWIIVSVIALFAGIVLLSQTQVSIYRALIAAAICVVWLFAGNAVVGIATGLTDTSPISGIALISAIFMVFCFGIDNIYAIVMISCLVCVAVGQGADMLTDLKTGYLVGANTRKQEVLKFFGPVLGSVISLLTLSVLAQTYGIGSEMLPAPQAGVLAGILGMIRGGEVPYALFLGGALLGGSITLTGLPGVLAGLGIYLPLSIPFATAIGGGIKGILDHVMGKEVVEEYTISAAAGLIVGAALTLVSYAIYTVVGAI